MIRLPNLWFAYYGVIVLVLLMAVMYSSAGSWISPVNDAGLPAAVTPKFESRATSRFADYSLTRPDGTSLFVQGLDIAEREMPAVDTLNEHKVTAPPHLPVSIPFRHLPTGMISRAGTVTILFQTDSGSELVKAKLGDKIAEWEVTNLDEFSVTVKRGAEEKTLPIVQVRSGALFERVP